MFKIASRYLGVASLAAGILTGSASVTLADDYLVWCKAKYSEWVRLKTSPQGAHTNPVRICGRTFYVRTAGLTIIKTKGCYNNRTVKASNRSQRLC